MTGLGRVPHCTLPSIKGSETRCCWQGSFDKPTRSRFAPRVAPPFTFLREGVIYRHGRLNGSLIYVPRYARRLANVSLAVLTQPPRELYSAMFLPDGGDKQAKSL